MSMIHGNDGVVKAGGTAVAEVTGWSYSEEADVAEGGQMGATSKTYGAGLLGGGGKIDCNWDAADQSALTVGSSVAVDVMPEGEDSGDVHYAGTVIVESKEITGDFGSFVSASFTFKGVLTEATVV